MAKLKTVKYNAEHEKFVVECDEYPLCVEGDTMAQVLDRMHEAVDLYRRTFHSPN